MRDIDSGGHEEAENRRKRVTSSLLQQEGLEEGELLARGKARVNHSHRKEIRNKHSGKDKMKFTVLY